jgi:hypothetical protein
LWAKNSWPAVGLDALNGKGHLLPHAFEEVDSVGGGAAGIEADNLEARAVVDGDVLVELRRNLTDIDLDTIARNRPAVALGALAP